MNDIFQTLTPVDEQLFYRNQDRNDARLGEILPKTQYENASIVIVGCPQDEGVTRGGGRGGSQLAPAAIREQFYRLTPFGISLKICDLGDVAFENSLEKCHEILAQVAGQVLADGKKLIVLGGGNDILYPNSRAMAANFGSENWIGVNVSSRFGVAQSEAIQSDSAIRKVFEERLVRPRYFYEIGYQTHFAAPVYYRYLQDLDVNLSSLEQIRSRETADLELREMMRERFIRHSESLSIFYNFSMSVVRSSDAPGTNFPSPLGLRAGEFITIVKFAASLSNTKIIQFTDVNPNFDVDSRTVSLVAIAMHRFCSLTK